MPDPCLCDENLELVQAAVRRFEAKGGRSLAPVFYLSLGVPDAAANAPTVRLEWLSEASQFHRAERAMRPLLDALRQRREVRGIVLVECEDDFAGARCKGETWFLEFSA